MNSTPVAAATAGPMSLPTRPKPFYRVLYIQVLIAIIILAAAMLTSKGASGVAGAGSITLAATLAVHKRHASYK